MNNTEKLKVAEDKLDFEGQPEVIYLEPLGGEGAWCTERQWEDDEKELGKLPAKYVRADLYLALEARCAEMSRLLKFARHSKTLSVNIMRDGEIIPDIQRRIDGVLAWVKDVDAALTDGGQG